MDDIKNNPFDAGYMADNRWFYRQFSEDEEMVIDCVTKNSQLFDDMLFKPKTITSPYVSIMVSHDNGATWEEESETESLPEKLECFSYTAFDFKVQELEEGTTGQFDGDEKTITISPEYVTEESVILHEMIHLHEYVINELPLFYHDICIFSLYEALKPQIPDLDERIKKHGHIFNETEIYCSGGDHDFLFLLKSFDLDLKKGYKLGTVFGYGYEED